MLAKWDLKTTAEGTEIAYHNLRDQVSMKCGTEPLSAVELLAFMVEGGGGGSELVFLDGEFALMLMPGVSDAGLKWRFLTGIVELEG